MSPRQPPTAYSTTSKNLRALLTPFWEMRALFLSLEDSVMARSSAMHTIFSTAFFCQATLYFPTIITRESPFLLSTTLNTKPSTLITLQAPRAQSLWTQRKTKLRSPSTRTQTQRKTQSSNPGEGANTHPHTPTKERSRDERQPRATQMATRTTSKFIVRSHKPFMIVSLAIPISMAFWRSSNYEVDIV